MTLFAQGDPGNDPVREAPTLTGPHGRAWRLDTAMLLARRGEADKPHSVVAKWMVEAAWAHPAWHSYDLTLVHLRPTAGLPAPRITVPGATHEFWLHALDPAFPRQAVLDRGDVRLLRPINFAAQVVYTDDATADADIEAAVKDILAGALCPDTDFVAQWAARFGDALLRRR